MKKLFMLPLLFLFTGCTSDITERGTIQEESTSTEYLQEETIVLDSKSNDEIDLAIPNPLIEELGISEDATFGSEGALVDRDYTIEEMLTYALEDELRAKAEYLFVIDTFEVANPFTNIMASEETHINLLLPLFETYQVDLVNEDVSDELLPATTLKETFEVGVLAEILNIEMYNSFLQEDLPADLEYVFTTLRNASVNHLASFERQLAKYA